MDSASVLPYRTDAVALAQWLEARARGRSAGQLRSAVDSPKAVEGTAAAAAALGFTDAVDGSLTDLGERYALADGREREGLLREVVLGFPAYQQMMRGVAERGAASETDVRWIEAWWSMRGFGSSASNRREGAAAFGRLADYAGLGEYIPGRRGRPTRIRWADGALPIDGATSPTRPRAQSGRDSAPDLFSVVPPSVPAPSAPLRRPLRSGPPAAGTGGAEPQAVPRATAASAGPSSSPDPLSSPTRSRSDVPMNRITVPLAGSASARIEVPLRLPGAEKRRLLDLLELLISEE